jgi:hypothetical protein
MTGIATCCARAASGHAAAVPAIPVMKSRRRICLPQARDHAIFGFQLRSSKQKFATRERTQRSICTAEIMRRPCLRRVINGRSRNVRFESA